jgi:excinuclease ABC subunit A
MSLNSLIIQGAREHNLRNIDVTIPKDKLVVITGLSGSGKSSLAFDTIYAEGQRRYVESLSAYARQFLEMMQKPDVDAIDGLSPAISIEQKTTSKNPRSTVGTITEIYDYLRLLFARIGVPISPATGLPIESQTVQEIVDRILSFKEGTKLHLLSPLVRGRKGEYRKELDSLQKQGFQRVKIDGTVYLLEDLPTLDKKKKHDIAVVVDRLVIRKTDQGDSGLKDRLTATVESALKLSNGLMIAEDIGTKEEILFSENFSCPVSGFTLEEIEPRLFSFNSPFGACPTCDGLGQQITFDEGLIIPDPSKNIFEGAIAPWSGSFSFYYKQALSAVILHYGEDPETAIKDLSPKVQKVILFGSGKESIQTLIEDGSHRYENKKPFEGVIPSLERRAKEKKKEGRAKEEMSRYQSSSLCPDCQGARLKPEALCVKIGTHHIGEVCDQSIESAKAWVEQLPQKLSTTHQAISERIFKELRERLTFLTSVGLNYLTLSRTSGTLSGGESQRIRLASQIGSGLTGVLYVLDEPSIGLHQRDNDRLLETLQRLRDLGNTVLVVEHDEDAIKIADHIIDMGPGAGIHGGSIVAEGPLQKILDAPDSLTGQYLSQKKCIEVPKKRRKGNGKNIKLKGVKTNNLKNITAEFPLGTLTCVTGVSGGGKSSLVIETLYKALAKELNGSAVTPGPYSDITGLKHIDKIIDIDQSPIGRTPRSNPATYVGAFTPIREWFAALPEAKARGYTPGRFSFNVKGGRCETCQGDGVLRIEMHFLPDVFVTCDQCHGKRYNRDTLEIKYKGKNIADILELSVEEGAQFFDAMPNIRQKLSTLQKVGLDYVHIGQQATTLSGGEAQRVKLAKELSKRSTGRTLYILDEPTTGLHFDDIRKLLNVLHALVDQGNTVIVIEHNLDVIKTADWVIDIGPEGGIKGGKIVATGTPEKITTHTKSYTGKYLNKHL